MPSHKNTEQLTKFIKKLDASLGVVFVDYQGLATRRMDDLRELVEEHGAKLHITKNTILTLALAKTKLVDHPPDDQLTSPTATLFFSEDFLSPIKTLYEFIKENGLPIVKGGIIEHAYVSAEDISLISKLPSFEQLMAKLERQIQAPVSSLANVLAANARNLVYVLSEIQTSKGGDSNG